MRGIEPPTIAMPIAQMGWYASTSRMAAAVAIISHFILNIPVPVVVTPLRRSTTPVLISRYMLLKVRGPGLVVLFHLRHGHRLVVVPGTRTVLVVS